MVALDGNCLLKREKGRWRVGDKIRTLLQIGRGCLFRYDIKRAATQVVDGGGARTVDVQVKRNRLS